MAFLLRMLLDGSRGMKRRVSAPVPNGASRWTEIVRQSLSEVVQIGTERRFAQLCRNQGGYGQKAYDARDEMEHCC